VTSRRRTTFLLILALASSATGISRAAETLTFPFFGVSHIDRTETSPRPLRIHAIKIDLTDPAISFLVTPQNGPRDTLIQTTRQFLSAQSAQLAINAHFFTPFPDDGTGTTWLISLAASAATSGPNGHAYAPFERNLGGAYQNDLPAMNIGADNTATLVYQAAGDATGYATDPPVTLHNAVSGNEQLLDNGVIVSGTTVFDNTLNPRTAIGIAPGNTLVLLTVDGRQPGVSEGVTTAELADLLHSGYGVTDAINLDGGGSTTLAMADPTPRLVNVPVGVNNLPYSERLVGSSLAVFAGACSTETEGMACGDVDPCNGDETCVAGSCRRGPAPNCDDGIVCTDDSCSTTSGCTHTANPVTCAVSVNAEGSRYLAVTPPAGLLSVALRVSATSLACPPMYVDAAGHLSGDPVFRSSSQWGTVEVGDRAIVPDTSYTVTAELAGGAPVAYGSATTGGWGNANGRGDVNVFDILCVIDGSQDIFTHCSRYADDQKPGVPDGSIDSDDIRATLEAFSGLAYPDADPCLGFGVSRK
jgi:hypothetical protein